MTAALLPFLTSVGALLFEFSLSHFLSISIGDSSFGFSFVIGVFLFFMGLGAFASERWTMLRARPLESLVMVEVGMSLLCLMALPALSWSSGVFKNWELLSESCRSVLCTRAGLLLIAETGVWLAVTGLLVGVEIPLFLRVLKTSAGRVLAADYFGAFVAGVVFPLLLLPRLGTLGTLIFAATLHLCVASALVWRLARPAKTSVALIVGVAWVLVLIAASSVDGLERWLLMRVLRNPESASTEILLYKRTRKQTVVVTRDQLPEGREDVRLYLEGFLQFSSAWNMRAYHEKMVLPAREQVKTESADILVLGGGDGLAAAVAGEAHAQDRVHVVDFDCELLRLAQAPGPLHEMARSAWSNSHVTSECTDAFAFVRQPAQKARWDLVLVDFPHGVGDAAAERVESLEFFRDLHAILKTGGVAVLQHENFGSQAEACVERTLRGAGFTTHAVAVREGQIDSEAMILGEKSAVATVTNLHELQTEFRTICSRLGPFGRILTGI